jgi:hypothetical protein
LPNEIIPPYFVGNRGYGTIPPPMGAYNDPQPKPAGAYDPKNQRDPAQGYNPTTYPPQHGYAPPPAGLSSCRRIYWTRIHQSVSITAKLNSTATTSYTNSHCRRLSSMQGKIIYIHLYHFYRPKKIAFKFAFNLMKIIC